METQREQWGGCSAAPDDQEILADDGTPNRGRCCEGGSQGWLVKQQSFRASFRPNPLPATGRERAIHAG